LAGCKVKGKKTCNVCGKDTPHRWLKFSRKYVYLGNRKRLRLGHPLKKELQIEFTQEKKFLIVLRTLKMISGNHWLKIRKEIEKSCLKMRLVYMMNMRKALINGDGRSVLFYSS